LDENIEGLFSTVFLGLLERSSEYDQLVEILDLKKEAELSFLCDKGGVQESFCLRSQRRALLIAKYLINEKGDLEKERLTLILSLLKKGGYITYPGGFSDRVITEHLIFVLTKLQDEDSFYKTIRKFRGPLCHGWAEDIIRNSIGVFTRTKLSDRDIRIGILSACLSSLRQNVGSCFATAPAIVIQKEQLERLLEDLYELLMTGKLKRVFGGHEYSVPLSPSFGCGDLYRTINLEKEQGDLFRSPGLSLAFQTIEIDPLGLFERLAEKEGTCTVGELIHKLLLTEFDLKEEDLVAYEKKQQILGQGGLVGFFSNSKTSQGAVCKEKEAMAKAAFISVADHPLLKAWEFTLASFSEAKVEFSNWNLYVSLGFHHEEAGGIGEILYNFLQKKLEESNEKMVKYQQEYALAYDQVKSVEILLKSASGESEVRRLQAEYNSRLYHMRSCLEIRDLAHKASSEYSSFFSFLLNKYKEKFQEYFQEIYDATMQDVKASQYEDSPAGFRLVYKHGRSNASLWTMIYNADQYIEALVAFFLAVEIQIGGESDWEESQPLLAEITSQIVLHLRQELFLKSAITRMAKAHGFSISGDPLSSLGNMAKKPWAYTSGGSMVTLLKTYYKKEGEFRQESKWVESPVDLLTFILDVLKSVPLPVEELMETSGMLISSPSHAFTLYPSYPLFKEGWQEKMFTYSWVRDRIVNPGREFYSEMRLSTLEQSFLVDRLAQSFPPVISHLLQKGISSVPVSIPLFRNRILELVPFPLEDQLDSFLFASLPLVPGSDWKNAVRKVLEGEYVEPLLSKYPDVRMGFVMAKEIRQLSKVLYLELKGSLFFSFDIHEYIARQMEKAGFSPPAPLLFADTNWTGNYFSFMVNPGTEALELWRVDRSGSSGVPMSSWQHWMNGQDRSSWNVFCNPFEYS
jgi:hypothetical protein